MELPPKQIDAPVQPAQNIIIETPPEPKPKLHEPPTFPKAQPKTARTKPDPGPPEPVASESPATQPVTGPVKPAEPLRLSPMLSEAEQRELNAAIKDLIERAERNFALARSRNLTTQQKELIRQAEVFLSQAQSVRETDLNAARSLAERAELLSREALR